MLVRRILPTPLIALAASLAPAVAFAHDSADAHLHGELMMYALVLLGAGCALFMLFQARRTLVDMRAPRAAQRRDEQS